jgi:hypothetical protein
LIATSRFPEIEQLFQQIHLLSKNIFAFVDPQYNDESLRPNENIPLGQRMIMREDEKLYPAEIKDLHHKDLHRSRIKFPYFNRSCETSFKYLYIQIERVLRHLETAKEFISTEDA